MLGKNQKKSPSLLLLLRQALEEFYKEYLRGLRKKTAAF